MSTRTRRLIKISLGSAINLMGTVHLVSPWMRIG